MKIKLLSDLHYEFENRQNAVPNYVIPNVDTDVLILAGDIGVGSAQVSEIIENFLDAGYENIVYLPGNHEYYGSSIEYFDQSIAARFMYSKHVHVLNPGTVKIGDVTFIGAPLWSNFGGDGWNAHICATRINDFNKIREFGTGDCVKLFTKHFDFIKHSYENIPGKKVIVTHFLPAVECISPRFAGPDVLNTYFANNLGGWISGLSDTVWCFGHTHDSVDMVIGDTRMMCNPYGYAYYETNKQFDPDFTFEV